MVNWISVEEQLPKNETTVLVFISGGFKEQSFFVDNVFTYYSNYEEFCKIDDVTHWIYMENVPSPFKTDIW